MTQAPVPEREREANETPTEAATIALAGSLFVWPTWAGVNLLSETENSLGGSERANHTLSPATRNAIRAWIIDRIAERACQILREDHVEG